jgi:thymidylate kinase/predicted pyridoxine 5'-phosphate oxidase superfamily flavin-nucleotide-binding protein
MELPNEIEIAREPPSSAGTPIPDAGGSESPRALVALANGFARSRVRYCVLHGWSRLPAWSDGDFDLAIDPDQLEIIDDVLENDCAGQIVQLLQHESTGLFFVARCEGHQKFVLVDAATDYRRDGRIFFSIDQLLEGAHEWNGFKVAAPQVEFAYLLVKKVSKRALGPHQRERLATLHDALGSQAVRIAVTLFGDSRGTRLDEWIAARRWDDFDRELDALRRNLRRTVLRRDPLNAVRYWAPEIVRRWHRWRDPSGLLIAIMGPDGAGKSTLIDGLNRNLGGAFRHTSSFHLRPAILRPRADGPPVTDPHGMPPRSLPASLAKVGFYIAEYLLGYELRLRPALGHTTLIFADRYFDDLLVDPRRYRYGGPAWMLRLARRLVPQPDLWLFLDVPEDRLLGRKREVSAGELRRQRVAYRELAADNPRAVVVDGASDAASVVAQAAEVCIDYLHSRYRSRRFKWLPHTHDADLKWLGSVALNPDLARFGAAPEASGGWRDSGDSFRWLRLGDGRGFLFPDDEALIAHTRDLYNAHNFKGRLMKSLMGRGIARRLPGLMRRVTIQYRNGPAPVGIDKTIFDLIRRTMDRTDLGFAVSLGTPGPHRKPVIQVVTPKGRTVAYAKVGANAATDALVKNEAATLLRLSQRDGLSFTFPRAMGSADWNGHPINLQSAPAAALHAASDNFSPEYLSIVDQISAIDRSRSVLCKSEFWSALTAKIHATRHPYFRHLLMRIAEVLSQRFGSQEFVFHFSHGDLAPWNLRRVADRLYLFDWEYAAPDRPVGWDIFHFFVQTGSLLKGDSAGSIWREFSATGAAAQWVNASFDRLALSRELVRPAFLLYLAGQLAAYADARNADAGKLRRLAMILNLGLGDLEQAP